MCWSMTADLVAGGAIGTAGLVCLARVRDARDLPLAALPLLLGVHQLVEAAIWHAGGGAGPVVTLWAVIALPLLPAWVPLGVLLAAAPPRPRRLYPPVLLGLLTSALLAAHLAGGTVTAEIRGRRIGYGVDLPHGLPLLAGYLLATIGALLLAEDRALRRLGLVTGVGAAGCAALWRLEFVSTWCALAAVASLLLLPWPRRRERRAADPAGTAGGDERAAAGPAGLPG
ncbi:DUF6629 family protein (plasmid) [Streptomyces sp. BI20]|uniref:DUF6629 family protein n=1 Tax=Streptomyces sp. BI20 TaxID=3403460 RepID=UPI003C78AE69